MRGSDWYRVRTYVVELMKCLFWRALQLAQQKGTTFLSLSVLKAFALKLATKYQDVVQSRK